MSIRKSEKYSYKLLDAQGEERHGEMVWYKLWICSKGHHRQQKHTSRLVSDYLEREICIKDYIIKWPPYSPDLNPIENLWANLKKRVERHTANTVQELEHAVKTEWANTDTTLCRKLVNSMPDRIARLKEYRGGPTGY
jgi:hypothetical protein